MSGLSPIRAETYRYNEIEASAHVGRSSNLGLECYLAEAFCQLEGLQQNDIEELRSSADRVAEEAVIYDGCSAWKWEKTPSISGVDFPPDWDDTSKAVDLVRAIQTLGLVLDLRGPIPDDSWWERHLKSSIFERAFLGVDTRLKSESTFALSVFLGDSRNLPKREDPMVTVATVRTTALWYPKVATRNRHLLLALLRRAGEVLNFSLNGVPFSDLSRYYFSAGHFAYRLAEAACLLYVDLEEIGVNPRSLKERVESHKEDSCLKVGNKYSQEAKWWGILEGFLGLCEYPPISTVERGSLEGTVEPENESPDIVFRHRRLRHYYGSPGWTRRLQGFEIANRRNRSPFLRTG